MVLRSCIGPKNFKTRLTNVKLLHSMYSLFSPIFRVTARRPSDSSMLTEARPKNFKSFSLNLTVLISILLVALLYLENIKFISFNIFIPITWNIIFRTWAVCGVGMVQNGRLEEQSKRNLSPTSKQGIHTTF